MSVPAPSPALREPSLGEAPEAGPLQAEAPEAGPLQAEAPEAGPLQVEVLEAGPLQVFPADRIARAWGHALMLSAKELGLLTELARRADCVMAREELYRLVWQREMRAGDRSVDVYVRRLRVKLERAMPGWRFIHTHFGFGYRLAPARSQLPDGTFTTG